MLKILEKHPFILELIEKIQNDYPNFDMTNFQSNLHFLEIEFGDIEDPKIFFKTKEQLIKIVLPQRVFNNYNPLCLTNQQKAMLTHELLHLSEPRPLPVSNELAIGFLESYTEFLAESMYGNFKDPLHFNHYIYGVEFAVSLKQVLGDELTYLYSIAAIDQIIDKLTVYGEKENIEKMFLNLSELFINRCSEKGLVLEQDINATLSNIKNSATNLKR